jgi:integrase
MNRLGEAKYTQGSLIEHNRSDGLLPPNSYVIGLNIERVSTHSLRATAVTNALDHEADIAKVQEWLGHANIATTRLYDRRNTRPEESPTFKVRF